MLAHEPTGRRTDEELAGEARAGSRRSFEELALRYKRRLFVFFRPRLGSDQDAEDMVQETFLKIFRNIESYDPAYRFSTWLYTSAHRLAISSYRKKKIAAVALRLEGAGGLADPTTETARDTAPTELWAAARTLGGVLFQVVLREAPPSAEDRAAIRAALKSYVTATDKWPAVITEAESSLVREREILERSLLSAAEYLQARLNIRIERRDAPKSF